MPDNIDELLEEAETICDEMVATTLKEAIKNYKTFENTTPAFREALQKVLLAYTNTAMLIGIKRTIEYMEKKKR